MKRRLYYVLLGLVLMLACIGCSSKKAPDNKITQDITQPPDGQAEVTQAPIQNPAEPTSDNLESYSVKKNLRFVVVADSRGLDKGVNSEIVRKVLSKIKELTPQPEFAIMPGDLTVGSKDYKEVKAQLEYFKEVITEFYPIDFFYPGIGNHEMRAGNGGEKAFSEVFNEFKANFLKEYHRTSYYIDVKDIRLFMLNSNHPKETHKIAGAQLDWLKANIDQSKRYNIFLLHEPPYPTGSGVGNSLDSYPGARDAFWKVIDSLDNSIVFSGHEHNYSRRVIDSSFNETVNGNKYEFKRSIYQIVTGGFGAPLYEQYTSKKNVVIPPLPQYHYTIVDINENGLNIQAVNLDGEIIDTVQIQ